MSFIKNYYGLLLYLFLGLTQVVVYFGLNYFGRFLAAYSNFGFAFEENIPLIPLATVVYFTVYFVYITPLFFVFSINKFRRMAAAYLFIIFVSGLIWVLFPTKMVWVPFVARSIPDGLILLLRGMDIPYCLFPSMHVSLAYLATFVVASENKKWGYFLAVATTLVTFSTLFTKQHYVVDLVAGFILGLFAYLVFVRKR